MLWFFCDVFAREGDATGRVVTRLAEALAREARPGRAVTGYSLLVNAADAARVVGLATNNKEPITNNPGRTDGESASVGGATTDNKEPITNNSATVAVAAVAVNPTGSAKGVRVHRVWAATFRKSRGALLGLNLVTTTAAYTWAAWRRLRRGDVVVVVTSPRLLAWPVAQAARARGARVIALVHDVYPDVFAVVGWLRREGWAYRAFEACFRRGFAAVERIVVLGRDMQALLEQKLSGNAAERIQVIPNWGEVETLRVIAKEDSPVTQRMGLAGKFVIGVGGTLGRTHDARLVAALAEELRGDEAAVLLVYASGVARAELDEAVRQRGLRNLRLAPPCAPEELNDWLAAADVMLIPFRAGMAGISVPSRMYNIFAAGRPLLVAGDLTSEAACVVREEGVGWAVAAGDVAGAAAIVREMIARPQDAAERGVRARALVERDYTFAQHVRVWRALLSQEL